MPSVTVPGVRTGCRTRARRHPPPSWTSRLDQRGAQPRRAQRVGDRDPEPLRVARTGGHRHPGDTVVEPRLDDPRAEQDRLPAAGPRGRMYYVLRSGQLREQVMAGHDLPQAGWSQDSLTSPPSRTHASQALMAVAYSGRPGLPVARSDSRRASEGAVTPSAVVCQSSSRSASGAQGGSGISR